MLRAAINWFRGGGVFAGGCMTRAECLDSRPPLVVLKPCQPNLRLHCGLRVNTPCIANFPSKNKARNHNNHKTSSEVAIIDSMEGMAGGLGHPPGYYLTPRFCCSY